MLVNFKVYTLANSKTRVLYLQCPYPFCPSFKSISTELALSGALIKKRNMSAKFQVSTFDSSKDLMMSETNNDVAESELHVYWKCNGGPVGGAQGLELGVLDVFFGAWNPAEREYQLMKSEDNGSNWLPKGDFHGRQKAAVAEWYRHRIVAGFVTSSSPVPLKTRRVGQRCTLNLSRAETSSRWCDVVVRRGGASSGVVHVT
ncbi:uncharacterized protein TNCV_4525341 [Trichonephila clavipes]|nr:uncharacterized protein TNCV_4525341 [Trichonephila clavipes]